MLDERLEIGGGLRVVFEDFEPLLESFWFLAETSARHCCRNCSNSGFESSILGDIVGSCGGQSRGMVERVLYTERESLLNC